MAHSFWRGEFIIYRRGDETADVYQWQPASGSYAWHSDWDSPEEAHRYIEEQTALRPFPKIKPINASVHPLPKLQDLFDEAWARQQTRRGEAGRGEAGHGEARQGKENLR